MGWYWSIRSHRFQVYTYMTHGMYTALQFLKLICYFSFCLQFSLTSRSFFWFSDLFFWSLFDFFLERSIFSYCLKDINVNIYVFVFLEKNYCFLQVTLCRFLFVCLLVSVFHAEGFPSLLSFPWSAAQVVNKMLNGSFVHLVSGRVACCFEVYCRLLNSLGCQHLP